jgi:D-threo-aldose 1-dehydrogenase
MRLVCDRATDVLKILATDYRPFGTTGLTLPPLALGTSALGNAGGVVSQPRKLTLWGEWLNCVTPPIWLETGNCRGGTAALDAIAHVARRLDISPDDFVISDSVSWNDVTQAWRPDCALLDDPYRPKLVALAGADEYLAGADTPAEEDRRLDEIVGAFQTLSKLKEAGEIAGVGLDGNDWRPVEMIERHVRPDWVRLAGCYSPLRHEPDLLRFMTSLSERKIPIVLAGIFQGGFLVGGPKLDNGTLDPSDPRDARHLAWRKSFVALCQGHGISPAHACIQFALSAPGVTAVAIDTTRPEHVAENVQSVLTTVPAAFWESMSEEGLLSE